jgi:hypothetical protein
MRQLLPSHRSARGSVKLESEAADEPTAVHARPEEHATDDSTLISAPTGSGVGSIVHVRPPGRGARPAGERGPNRDDRRQPKQEGECPSPDRILSAASSHRRSLP